MLKRVVAMLVCSCLIAGSLPDNVYAMQSMGDGVHSEYAEDEYSEDGYSQDEEFVTSDVQATNNQEFIVSETSDVYSENSNLENVEQITDDVVSENQDSDETELYTDEWSEQSDEIIICEESLDGAYAFETISLNEKITTTVGYNNTYYFEINLPEAGDYYLLGNADKSVEVELHARDSLRWLMTSDSNKEDEPLITSFSTNQSMTIYGLCRLSNASSISSDATVNFMLAKTPEYSMEVAGNGVITAKNDEISIQITPNPSYKEIFFDAKMDVPEESSEEYSLFLQYTDSYANPVYDTALLAQENNYTNTVTRGGCNPGNIYGLEIYLFDSNRNLVMCPIVKGAENDYYATKTFDGTKVALHNVETDYNSISFDCEVVDSMVDDIGIIKVGDSSANYKLISVNETIEHLVFENLDPNSSYKISVFDSEGYNLGTIGTYTTSKFDSVINYNFYSGTTIISAVADIVRWTGKSSNFDIYCDVIDIATGNVMTGRQAIVSSDDISAGTIDFVITGVEANTDYLVKVYVKESLYGPKLCCYESRVTTGGIATAEGVTIDFEEQSNNALGYTITVNDFSDGIQNSATSTTYFPVKIICRPLGECSNPYEKNSSIYVTHPTITGSFPNMKSGVTYEIIFEMDGIKVTKLYTYGESAYDKTTEAEIGIFNAKLAYELDMTTIPTGNYTLKLQIKDVTNQASALSTVFSSVAVTKNANGIFRYEYDTENYEILDPDTEYLLCWTLYQNGTAVDYTYQTIHTNPIEITITAKDISFNTATFQVTCPNQKCASVSNGFKAYLSYPEMSSMLQNKTLDLTSDVASEFTFEALHSNSKYVVVITYGYNRIYTKEFTTAKLPGKISSVTVNPGYSSAIVNVTADSLSKETTYYTTLFYRDKGSVQWSHFENLSVSTNAGKISASFEVNCSSEVEYAVAIHSSRISNITDIQEPNKIRYGTIVPKPCDYQIKITPINITDDSFELIVEATGPSVRSKVDSEVKVDLVASDYFGTNIDFEAVLTPANNYKTTISSGIVVQESGLRSLKIYDADIYVKSNYGYTNIGTVDCYTEFSLVRPIPPTSITLDKSEVALNHLTHETCQLTATILPSNAMSRMIWSSSDVNVAEVTQTGMIVAKGVGEATITATTLYNDETHSQLSASCKVVVSNYELLRQTGIVGYVNDSYVNMKVGEETGKFMFYDNATVKYFRPATVTVEGDGVVRYNKETDTITALRPGFAKVQFVTENGIPFYVDVIVQSQLEGVKVTGLSSSSDYPAIQVGENEYIIAATRAGSNAYTIDCYIDHNTYYNSSDFEFSSSNSLYAAVSASGTITPSDSTSGDVKITITSKNMVPQISTEITLHVLPLPSTSAYFSEIDVLADDYKTLGEINIHEGDRKWDDNWSWRYPESALYANLADVNENNRMVDYDYEVIYNGDDCYPLVSTIKVNRYYIYNMYFTDFSYRGINNPCIQVKAEGTTSANTDLNIRTEFSPINNTFLKEACEVRCYKVTGLDIIGGGIVGVDYPDENTKYVTSRYNQFTINATKAGKYNLKFEVVSRQTGKVLITKTVSFTAINNEPIGKIGTLSVYNENLNPYVLTREGYMNYAYNSITDKDKVFYVVAPVENRNGDTIQAKLNWTSSNINVAVVSTVQIDINGDGELETVAKVAFRGQGYTRIAATATDGSQVSNYITLTLCDYMPHLDTTNVKVNLAYDYVDYRGQSMAMATGSGVIVTPVYGENILATQPVLYEKTVGSFANEPSLKVATDYTARWYYSYNQDKCFIIPTETAKVGTKQYWLVISTNHGDFAQAIKITAVKQGLKASSGGNSKLNLFYMNNAGSVTYKISGFPAGVNFEGSIYFEDQNLSRYNGFTCNSSYDSNAKAVTLSYSAGSGVRVANHKLVDTGIDQGQVRIFVAGYKDEIIINNVKLPTTYTVPKINGGSSSIIPSLGKTSNSISIYNTTDKIYMIYGVNPGEFTRYECLSNNVDMGVDYGYLTYNYIGAGTGTKDNIKLALFSNEWREPLVVNHTINIVKNPKVSLTNSNVTFNTMANASTNSRIEVNGIYNNFAIDSIDIVGADAKSKDMLSRGFLEIYQNSQGSNVLSVFYNMERDGVKANAGTYNFKITPYYKDVNGNRMKLNTMTYKVILVSAEPKVTVSTSGTINILDAYSYIAVRPKFTGIGEMGNGYVVSNIEIEGEYKDYFDLGYQFLGGVTIKQARGSYPQADGKLRAGVNYNIRLKYTIKSTYYGNNETFEVISNVITVRPKMTAPKLTIEGNNASLYLSENKSATITIQVPDGYTINSISGSLDINKDGVPDLMVSGYGNVANINAYYKDNVPSAPRGKVYKIPVSLTMRGADGTKPITTTISVKVYP